jgi:lipopolysaccharide/colanic/teichoic acid biosynthesis glycosyltransferase
MYEVFPWYMFKQKTMGNSSIYPPPFSVVYAAAPPGAFHTPLAELIEQFFDTKKGIHFYEGSKGNDIKIFPFNQIVLPIALNRQPDINILLEEANAYLDEDGLLAGFTETAEGYKKKILNKNGAWLRYGMQFLLHRVFPKLNGTTNKIYKQLNKNRSFWYTMPEVLGMLYRNGFHILEYKKHNDVLFFVAQKRAAPDKQSQPTYWPIVKMRRVGRNGKIISVYKFRTMHPYAEYLQEYIKNKHGLDAGGKFKNDIRVSSWGRFMRKYWLDELPMIINVLKGDLKIIGVRPISKHYFSLYSEELQNLRRKHKPGLIPPFYADMPRTLEEIMESEKRYMLQYEKAPFKTDCRYAWRIVNNIFVKKARSK